MHPNGQDRTPVHEWKSIVEHDTEDGLGLQAHAARNTYSVSDIESMIAKKPFGKGVIKAESVSCRSRW